MCVWGGGAIGGCVRLMWADADTAEERSERALGVCVGVRERESGEEKERKKERKRKKKRGGWGWRRESGESYAY